MLRYSVIIRLKGKAKALVVTKDIECAILYYKALQKLVEARKLPYKILIAFSGEKQIIDKSIGYDTQYIIQITYKLQNLVEIIMLHAAIQRQK